MGYIIGAVLGALLVTYAMSRLALWALKRIGDRKLRILIAHPAAFALAVVLGGLGYADGGPPRFLYAASVYVVPALLWFCVDLLALKGRSAKA